MFLVWIFNQNNDFTSSLISLSLYIPVSSNIEISLKILKFKFFMAQLIGYSYYSPQIHADD